MDHSTSLIFLVAALHINTLPYCSAENVHCVIPTATSCSSCPHNTHCATLSEYAQQAELYFTSNTTMVFLAGDHTLDRNITVANVARLTMHGEISSGSVAKIVGSGSVGLIFTSMVDFKIHFLAFASCSRIYEDVPAIHYALLLQSTQSAELVNCSFHDNLATALVLINANITLVGNIEFTHNHCDSDPYTGGGIIAISSNLKSVGNTTFLDNVGNGGAIFALQNSVLSFNGTNNFINNSADYGGAINAIQSVVFSFTGISTFTNNSANKGGGAIYALHHVVLSFNGTNNFTKNTAGSGGAIYTSKYNSLSFSGTSNFISNSADYGGAIFAVRNNVLNFYGTNNFNSNSANQNNGGAINTFINTVLTFNGTNNFINNSAPDAGGAIHALINAVFSFNGANNFINNSAGYGGAIDASRNTVLSFNGTANFMNNSADHSGGAIGIDNTSLTFYGTSNLTNNSAYYGGGIYAIGNTISFTGTSNFINNSAYYGGALCIYNSLSFNGTSNFISNTAEESGGGLYVGIKSTFSILPKTTLYWENNHATLGGAIYVKDVMLCNPYVPEGECFFQLPGQNLSTGIDVQLVFKDNSADDAGSVLYGGAIDNCKLTDLDSYSSGDVFDMIFHIDDTNYNRTSQVSSDPLQICPCVNNLPDCGGLVVFPNIYPGETAQVSAVALGQRNGPVPSTVRNNNFLGKLMTNFSKVIWVNLGPADLLDSQYLQLTKNICTKLNYTVLSLSHYVGITLHAEGTPCSVYDYKQLPSIFFNLTQNCPPGFKLSESAKSCVCEPRLAKYSPQCNITNGVEQITRQSSQHFWVGFDNQSHGLILNPHCPFDYCVNERVVFLLDSTDLQCAYNRSGLLCGRCKEGYSLVLGTSQCKKCTNSRLVLLIPFAVMGVALVFLLLVCKLTVATGMLSGLVFYANIVGPNRTIFLPVESTNVFSIFIAWLNLDFGIETCFYDGLDTYSKTWLQFVFPVYIWVLVGFIILVSHFSRRFANLLGKNPVSVLATLILLSYTKILRTLITVLYVTYLEYPKHNRMVWLYDGNIDYLSGKHIPLFLVAMLVFLFLFLPYTLLLLFGQWLQAISHLKLFAWVNRLKPFMDSYHAPYKGKHRFWPGLLLVFRLAVLLVFAFQFSPQQHRDSINLLAILVGTGTLVVWAWVSGGVYSNWCLDALEGSFVLNLIILVGATSYVKFVGGNQLAVGYTSVSIAFATFIGILVFQLATVTGIDRYLKRVCTVVAIRSCYAPKAEAEPPENNSLPDRLINPGNYEQPYHTPQKHTESNKGEELVHEAQRSLLPVYTYGSIN